MISSSKLEILAISLIVVIASAIAYWYISPDHSGNDENNSEFTVRGSPFQELSSDFMLTPDMTPVLIWNETWGGSGNEGATSMVMDNNEIYVVGYTINLSKAYKPDLIILKYDSTGTLVWNVTWDSGGWDMVEDVAVHNGEIYIVGNTAIDSPSGGTDTYAFLLKFNISTVKKHVQAKGTLKGNITDERNGSPISNAIIEIKLDTTIVANGTSDSNGHYTITDIPIGRYDITVSASGYEPMSEAGVTIVANQTTTKDFRMHKIIVEPIREFCIMTIIIGSLFFVAMVVMIIGIMRKRK